MRQDLQIILDAIRAYKQADRAEGAILEEIEAMDTDDSKDYIEPYKRLHTATCVRQSALESVKVALEAVEVGHDS